MTTTVTTTDTACVDCGGPADPYSPADDANCISAGRRCNRCWLTDPYSPADDANCISAGRRCNRCWLTDPTDVKPSRIQAEQYAARAVVAYLAAV